MGSDSGSSGGRGAQIKGLYSGNNDCTDAIVGL